MLKTQMVILNVEVKPFLLFSDSEGAPSGLDVFDMLHVVFLCIGGLY